MNASSGIATFSGIKIDMAGSYSVSAAGASLLPTGASDSFTISPAAPARLVIHTQPSSIATAGQAFGIQPEVDEVDQFGNLETGDNSTAVTASLSGGTGPLQGMTDGLRLGRAWRRLPTWATTLQRPSRSTIKSGVA